MALPPRTPRPTTEPNKNGMDTATDVEIQRHLNEFHRKYLDDRTKDVDWWLTVMVITLALFSIVTVIVGYIGLEKLDETKAETRKDANDIKEAIRLNAEVASADIRLSVEAAKDLLEQMEGHRDKAKEYEEELRGVTAKIVRENPQEAARTAASVRGDPAASLINRAIASAVQLQQQEKTEDAIEKWRSIANLAEDRQIQTQAWFSIGYLRSEGESMNLEAAIDAFSKAIELAPNSPYNAYAYAGRGNVKHSLGQDEAAVADLDRAIELDPNSPYAYAGRGNVKHSLGQDEAAVADLDRAIELAPNSPYNAYAYAVRGNVKHSLGQDEAAVADLDRAIELAPNSPYNAYAYAGRGHVKWHLGQDEAAVADSDRAIELDPNSPYAYAGRGNVKHSLGQDEAAVADLDRAIELAPNSPYNAYAYAGRGHVKHSLGRINEAREDHQKALDLAQESGSEAIVAEVKRILRPHDNHEEP